MKSLVIVWTLLLSASFSDPLQVLAADVPSDVSDQDRLIRIETRLDGIDGRLGRLEGRFNRFEERIDDRLNRFEDGMDKEMASIRGDLNSQLASTRAELNSQLASTRADLNSQLASTRAELSGHLNRMNNMLIGFLGLLAVGLGLTMWDRRSVLKPIETEIRQIEADVADKGSKRMLESAVNALRAWGQEDQRMAAILKRLNLL